jgi:hypothetical protein
MQGLFRVLLKISLHPIFGSYNYVFVPPKLFNCVMTVLWHSYFKLVLVFVFARLAQIDRVTNLTEIR